MSLTEHAIENEHRSYGKLALKWCKLRLPLQVLHSHAGYYIGTSDEGLPVSRESACYYRTEKAASDALTSGDWPQKEEP